MLAPLDKRMRHLEITGGGWAAGQQRDLQHLCCMPSPPTRAPVPSPVQVPCGSRPARVPCCVGCPSCRRCPTKCSRPFCGRAPSRVRGSWAWPWLLLHCAWHKLPAEICCLYAIRFRSFSSALNLRSPAPCAEYKTGVAFWSSSDLPSVSGLEAGPGAFVVLSGVVRRIHTRPDGTVQVGASGGLLL